jgi:hypothetical protein
VPTGGTVERARSKWRGKQKLVVSAETSEKQTRQAGDGRYNS